MGCAGSKDTEQASGDDVKAKPQPVLVRNSATGLSTAQLDRIRALFTDYDVDGKGLIELAALSTASVKIGPTESKVLSTLKAMDFNGDGYVDKSVRIFPATACCVLCSCRAHRRRARPPKNRASAGVD